MKAAMPRRTVNRAEHGLTLLEVMVVILIMGMIAGIVSKVVVGRVQEARVETAKTQMAEFAGALDTFHVHNGFYPTTEQGLGALVEKPTSSPIPKQWAAAGYMKAIPLDPWGRKYIYIGPASGRDFEIICLGRNGEEGGEGFDADISSSQLGAAEQE